MLVETTTSTQTTGKLKSNVGQLTLQPQVPVIDLRQYAHFDSSPSIGTEFKPYYKEGKPTLSIKEVLQDEGKLRALGKLV